MIKWIPLVNSVQAEVLPLSMWHDMHITHLAYRLEPLLIKPGAAVLLTFPSLAAYLGWTGKIVLDITGFNLTTTQEHVLTSPFDGRKITMSQQALSELIAALKVAWVFDGETTPPSHPVPTDQPLRAAIAGQFFENQQWQSIVDQSYRMNNDVMQVGCQCAACAIQLTKAYLHHVWFHVPALCLRLLAQHNAIQLCSSC